MAELERILGEARETHRQMQETVRTSGERPAGEIIRLRTRFATLVAELMGAIKADSRLQAHPDLAHEFESRFTQMRQSLSGHQAQWQSEAIDADPASYRRSTDELGREQDDFYSWANEALARS